MKYLVLLIVLLAALWLWRSARRRDGSTPPARPEAKELLEPQDMVRCPVCSVHLPRADALPGPKGLLYCSVEHQLRVGD